MSNARKEFVSKGASFAQEVLNEQADYAISLKYDPQLAIIIRSNQNILGDNIRTSSDLPKTIRSKIEAYSVELRSVIESTAAYIEKNKFESVEQAVEAIKLGIAEKENLQDILKAQRKLSLSFESVNIATDIFLIINQKLRDELKNISSSKETEKYPDLLLKNAVLVYELTGFLINYLDKCSLSGISDIEKLKQDVENRLKAIEMNNQEIEEKVKGFQKNSEEVKSALNEVQEQRKITKLCRDKWDSFDKRINDLQNGIEKIKNVIPTLELHQLTAKGRILTLDLIMVMRAFEANISLINTIADVKKFALEPFTVEDAQLLLGLSKKHTYLLEE